MRSNASLSNIIHLPVQFTFLIIELVTDFSKKNNFYLNRMFKTFLLYIQI